MLAEGRPFRLANFNKLMTDCKVCDNIFTRTYIDPIFVRANWEIDEEGNKIDSKNNPDRAMTSSEFVEGLIRVAHGKFNSSMGGTVLTMCLRKLVYQRILNSSATHTLLMERRLASKTWLKYLTVERVSTDGRGACTAKIVSR